MGGLLSLFRRGGEQGEQQRRSGPSRVTEQDKAVLALKNQRDRLQRYQKKIEIQMGKEREIAKQLLRDGKKERAKLLLKKKRYLESILEKTDTQMDNLQQMVENIEFAQIEIKVVEGLKQGNEALDALHKIMSLEDAEKIMGDTQDAIEYQREIDELLGQNLTGEDEDAIAEELESILMGELPVAPVGTAEGEQEQVIELPEVPTEPPREPAAAKTKREAVPA